jgi:tryptophanyl-tRNA synthetase
MTRERLVSGIQSTGKMHLGNYLGAVKNWVGLQEKYDSFFFIADLHSLTTVYENPGQLKQDKLDLALDLLAAGIDPEKCNLFYQSDVLEHAELHLVLSMITPLSWLTRVPSYKGKMAELKEKDLNTYGFLGYPVLQAADILLYKGDIVPVGVDQMPHIELTREIARRFNHFFGDVFPEPGGQLTNCPALPGLDGRKMSKSYKNSIPISLEADQMSSLVMKMFTDPSRLRRHDPGNPEICPVFAYHKIYNNVVRQEDIKTSCKSAEIGCVDCKKEFASLLVDSMSDFREKRKQLENNLDQVELLLKSGARKAAEVAAQTISEVKEKIGL